MTAEPAVLETVARRTPVGVAFRDHVTGSPVTDGLHVSVVPVPPGRETPAFRTPRGVYAANGLPGLRPAEFGEPEGEQLRLPYRLDVRDLLGRFHDVSIEAELPSDGLLLTPCGSPPLSPPAPGTAAVVLFSRPGRPAPPGMAVVRASLRRASDGEPAAWSALEVTPMPGERPARGIADVRGQVIVFFPYPEPVGLAGSPPAGTKRPLSEATWQVGVQVFLPRPTSPPEIAVPPNVCTFLDQFPATLLMRTSPLEEVTETTLAYGEESVLRTSPLDPQLLVSP